MGAFLGSLVWVSQGMKAQEAHGCVPAGITGVNAQQFVGRHMGVLRGSRVPHWMKSTAAREEAHVS